MDLTSSPLSRLSTTLFNRVSSPWNLAIVVVLVYTVGHAADLTSIYRYRLLGYENMVPALHNMMNPELYPGSELINRVTDFARFSSPLYFGLLALPLSSFFHPVTTMKIIGIGLALLLFVFGTWPGESEQDWIRGSLLLLFFLHVGIVMSPIPGNRKNFTVVMLMAGLIADRQDSPWGRFYTIALSAGLYPPTALLLLVFFYSNTVTELFTENYGKFQQHIREAVVSVSLFAGVLGPYLISKVLYDGFSSDINQIHQRWVSLLATSPLNREFWVNSLGSLFRYRRMMISALVLWGLVLMLYLVSDRWASGEQYWRLIVCSLSLWVIAHLIYPTIYQPNKYTKVVPQLIALILIGNNIPHAYTRLHKMHFRNKTRISVYCTALLGLGYYALNLYCRLTGTSWPLPEAIFLHDQLIVAAIAVVSLFAGLGLATRRISPTLSLTVILLLSALITFSPHESWFRTYRGYPDQSPSYFRKAFRTLRQTPVDTTVGSPNPFARFVSMYGKRNEYFRLTEKRLDRMQRRGDRLKAIYCADRPSTVRSKLKSTSIDVLFVDGELLGGAYCGGEQHPYLRKYDGPTMWEKGEYALIDRAELLSKSPVRSVKRNKTN